MSAWVSMGGDGAYVWSAYGITLAVLILNVWLARGRRKTALQQARDLTDQAPVPRKQPTVRRMQ